MLFGTDGIRGKVCLESCSDPVDALVNERKITPDLLWLVGHVLSMKVEKRSRVIIGWDNRPDNPVLVQALANALDDEEIEVLFFSKEKIRDLIYSGVIKDSATIAFFFKVYNLI